MLSQIQRRAVARQHLHRRAASSTAGLYSQSQALRLGSVRAFASASASGEPKIARGKT